MRISEIFSSIDGEGRHSGGLALFIRTAGCNLHCVYCDTQYACSPNDGYDMSVDDIMQEVKASGLRYVTLTGGEPLLQKDAGELLNALRCENIYTSVETNGSIELLPFMSKSDQDPVSFCVDYKVHSSGMHDRMCGSVFENLREQDTLKFVMTPDDEEEMQSVLIKYAPKCRIYLSPIFGECRPVDLVSILKRMQSSSIDALKLISQNTFVQVQLHKIIWPADMRGV